MENIPNALSATDAAPERPIDAQSRAVWELSTSRSILEGDVDAVARQLTEVAAKIAEVARASVWLFNEAEDELRCIDLYESARAWHSSGMVLREEEFPNEFTELKQAPYVDPNEPRTDRRVSGYFESYLKPLGVTSMLDTVVAVSGRHFGLLCLEHVGRPHQWRSDEIVFAARLADQIAVTLALGSARQAADEARMLARHAQESPNAVMRLSADGCVRYANPASASLRNVCGAGVGEFVKGPILELLPECMASGRMVEVELQDDQLAFVIQLVPFAADGYANLYGKDITLRKQTEAALVASRDLFASVVENVPARVFWKDANLRFLGCNTPFARDAGFAYPGNVVGRDDFQMPWRAQAELYRADDRVVMESGEAKVGIEEPQSTPDGRTIWLRASKVPWHGADGRIIGILGMYDDITEQKLAQERLRQSEERFRGYFERGLVGMSVSLPDKRFIDVNQKLCEISGYSREELLCMDWESLAHPDDLAGNIERFDRLLNSDAEHYVADRRFVRKDGSTVYCTLSLSCVRRADRSVEYLIALIQDVTDRRQAEESLRQSEERFRGYFEYGLIGMAVTLPNRAMAEVNDKVCEMFGYAREDLLRMDWASLTHPDDLAADVAQFDRVLRDEIDSYVLDKRFIHRDGAMVYCTISVSAVRQANRSVKYIVALIQDITERKLAEKTLHTALTSTVEAIAATIETRDPYTAGHQRSVADLAAAIGREMGLPEQTIEGIHFGALIHDLGKIQVPAELLTKPTRLSKAEMELIKTHPDAGYQIVKDIKFPWPVAEMVHQHHERLDGTGYPLGLKGDAIALEARIIAVADTVEAMASNRPYRPGTGIERALEQIQDRRGTWFDPAAVDACVRLFREKGFTMKESTFG